MLSDLDARVLRATELGYERSPERIGQLAGCAPDVALSRLRRLRLHYLVEPNGYRPAGWLRTPRGEAALATIARSAHAQPAPPSIRPEAG